jgi:hypothetical protein
LKGIANLEAWTGASGSVLFVAHGVPGEPYDVAIFTEGRQRPRRARGQIWATYYNQFGIAAWQETELVRFADGKVVDKRAYGNDAYLLMDRDASKFLIRETPTRRVHVFDVRAPAHPVLSTELEVYPYLLAVCGDRILIFGWDIHEMSRGSRTPKHSCIAFWSDPAGVQRTQRYTLPYGTTRVVDEGGRFAVIYRQVLPTVWKPFVCNIETGKFLTLPVTGMYVFARTDWIGKLTHTQGVSIPLP